MANDLQFDATDPQFVPVDPSQWHTSGLPHIIVHPYTPPNAPSDNRLVSDSPDGGIVPGTTPGGTGSPNDWVVPWSPARDALYPNDWIVPWSPARDAFYPNDWIYPPPAAAPNPEQHAPNVQPGTPNGEFSGSPATPSAGSFAPPPGAATRAPSFPSAAEMGAMAWQPPIFPGQWSVISHDNSPPPSLAKSTLGSDQASPPPPGFLGTLLEAARRGIVEGTTESLDSASAIARALKGQQGFLDRPSAGLPRGSQLSPDVDNVGQLLRQPLSEGWSNPDWWAAQAAFGGAKSYPSATLGLAGMAVGSAAEPGLGTAVGGGLGYGLGSLIQTLAPAYQRARAEGLDHEAAVDRALKATLVETGFGAALGGAPGVALFGKTLEGALKRPVSELLAQIFGVQPGLAVVQDTTRRAVEGAPVTANDLISDYVNGLVSGAMRAGAYDAFRRWHGSVWWDLPMLRGLNAERKLGQNLHEYYPVIDIHDPKTGAVTSIKSIDLRSRGYQERPNSVNTTLRRHVNELANFQGAEFAGHVVPEGSIASRTLLVAVPKSQTAAQKNALQRTIEYGNQQGVTVKAVVVR